MSQKILLLVRSLILILLLIRDASAGQTFSILLSSTSLAEVSQKNVFSQKIRTLANGSFETSNGKIVQFRDWYFTHWIDTSITLITKYDEHFGVVWGVNTGESGKKYKITPGIDLGLMANWRPNKYGSLTISGITKFGGRLREHTCTANYQAIGGVQKVNCRLAASQMEPSRTLNYLYNEKPQPTMKIIYTHAF